MKGIFAAVLALIAAVAFAHPGGHYDHGDLEGTKRTAPPLPALALPAALRSQTFALGSTALVQNNGGGSIALFSPPPGNGLLMTASFSPFRPRVRSYNDGTYLYVEGDNVPDPAIMPSPMVGISSWQQQIPLPTSYFFATTNPDNNAGSLGYGQPNVWRLPLVPMPAASPISLNGNFLRGAVAVAANGIAIFNPRNNRGEFSYAIEELDQYGGHCGLADDYHYHIAPVHLQSVLGVDKPVAWALDGYPIYGFTEPDGSPQLPLDADGGHEHGTWGYHYHARGSTVGGHVAPYLMDAMHGTVVNFGGQVDPQPEVQSMRASGTGGYNAQAVAGAVITAFINPVAFSVDGSGHFVHNPAGTPSEDQYLMRYTVGATAYDICWRINRNVNPKTLTITFRHPTTGTTTTTYTNGTNNRLKAYPMAAWSMVKLPDTTAQDATAAFGEDADYAVNPQSFTDNGDGTITDNVTGLMWQKTDNGESTWDAAVTNAAAVTTGGYNDWRLPTPVEAFSILNHANNPAVNLTYLPNNPAGSAAYWWTSDVFGTDATRVWCTNSGGGLGAHPKSETLSAGGALRFHARYVRGPKPTNGHNYLNNNDGTITDLDTGLMWTQVPSAAMNWNAALAHAEGLTTAGYTDWRLPNVKELQTLVDITLATATSAASAQPCLQRKLFSAATATAYWSSTPLRSGAGTSTQAWLVEFGVNTSSVPQRNSQGIVSYEPFASNYPVFAVRTTSVTTQIGVEQPSGSPLSDGISAVGFGNVNIGSIATKTFTILNNGATSLTISGVTVDGADAALFTVASPPAAFIPAGAATTMTMQFSAATAGSKTAALHIASSDTAAGAAFDVTLTGSGFIPPPTITNTLTSPNTPTYVDKVFVNARLQAASGATVTSAKLTYSDGSLTTGPVYTETMAAAAVTPWTGTNANNPWTVNGTANTIRQLTAANHGIGNSCGLQFDKGTVTITDNYVTTTNNIPAAGTAGYVEFWLGAQALISPNGWTFQLSTDGGATWTTRLSELTGSNHAMQLYHYDLLATERVNTLRMRFQFAGYNAVAPTPAPKVSIDDIAVVTTSGNPPVDLTMFDDGLHGDGIAGDGIFGAEVPLRAAGTTITYSLSVTDSNGSTTTSVAAASYTVSAITPPTNFAATLTANGSALTIQWPSQAGISYSVQTSEDLINWTNIPVGQVGTWTDPGAIGAAAKRFYRVMR